MARPAHESRVKVYQVLKRGANQSEAAALLGLTRPTVSHHADELCKAGALIKRSKGPGHPSIYGRGARAMLWEAQNLPSKTDRAGRSTPGADGAARVHRGEFKVKMAPWANQLPLPEPEKVWAANGVDFREWWHTIESGHRIRVRLCKGPHNCSLVLQPEEERVAGPTDAHALEVAWAHRVELCILELEQQYGFQRAGAAERSTPMEFEWEAPLLAKGVRAQRDDGAVWTDASKGPVSIETDSKRVATAISQLPEFLAADAEQKRDMMARLDAIQNQAANFGAGSLLESPEILEPIVRSLELHGDALGRILGVRS